MTFVLSTFSCFDVRLPTDFLGGLTSHVANSFVRRYVRPLVPFPKRRTLLRYFPSFETKNIAYILESKSIDVVLDVGANTGQFGTRLRSAGFKHRVISFEPNLEAHAKLLCKTRHDPNWEVAAPVALGDAEGSGTLIIPEDQSLGSILPFLHAQPSRHQTTAIKSLDTVLQGLQIPEAAKIAIKIDVQGYEQKVLDGARAALKRAVVVLIEVSLIPTYVGEQSYLEILSRLRDCGLHAVYFAPVTSRKIYGECFQTDVLLVRR